MELFELQKNIKDKEIPKFMIFNGPEYAIMNLYINKISGILGTNIKSLDSVQSSLNLDGTVSFIKENFLYVVRYDKWLMQQEKLWDKIEKLLGSNHLIMIYSSLDKRTKFYKKMLDKTVTFDKQPEETLRVMLKSIANLNDENLTELISGCDGNYSICVNELEKLKHIENVDINQAFKYLVSKGVIHLDTGDILFKFTDGVLYRDKKCYALYDKLKKAGESGIKILSILYTQFKNQLVVETVRNPTQENTGISGYFIYQSKMKKGRYTVDELKNALKYIVELEQGIKSGIYDESQVVEFLLVHIL